MKSLLAATILIACLMITDIASAANILYIHGRVSARGVVLNEGEGTPFDQMLITDSGATGLSIFRDAVVAAGHQISQARDTSITLNSNFLDQFDVLVFGLHQKLWSSAEKTALDSWLRAGGGMFIYSDSASGGRFNFVGGQNPVGQGVTNNLIAQYGMQVTVDQADGTNSQTASSSASITAIRNLNLEGEGVSPIAIAPGDSNVEILIPYIRNQTPLVPFTQNITIPNPVYASMALRPLGQGHVVAMFDRQPMWNNGPGSDIDRLNNQSILVAVMNFLAPRPSTTPPNPTPNNGSNTVVPPIFLLLSEESE